MIYDICVYGEMNSSYHVNTCFNLKSLMSNVSSLSKINYKILDYNC